ncbi:hypothetical protein DFH06DRAFT_1127895 [Mycena polygramma]|nr:hypothetical protein DFH06DRAFT_1127895 [Mycena polygramma]
MLFNSDPLSDLLVAMPNLAVMNLCNTGRELFDVLNVQPTSGRPLCPLLNKLSVTDISLRDLHSFVCQRLSLQKPIRTLNVYYVLSPHLSGFFYDGIQNCVPEFHVDPDFEWPGEWMGLQSRLMPALLSLLNVGGSTSRLRSRLSLFALPVELLVTIFLLSCGLSFERHREFFKRRGVIRILCRSSREVIDGNTRFWSTYDFVPFRLRESTARWIALAGGTPLDLHLLFDIGSYSPRATENNPKPRFTVRDTIAQAALLSGRWRNVRIRAEDVFALPTLMELLMDVRADRLESFTVERTGDYPDGGRIPGPDKNFGFACQGSCRSPDKSTRWPENVYEWGRVALPTSTGGLKGCFLSSWNFLVLLPKDETVKTFRDHVEIGFRAYSLFGDLEDEKEPLSKAVASLNTVRRKGKEKHSHPGATPDKTKIWPRSAPKSRQDFGERPGEKSRQNFLEAEIWDPTSIGIITGPPLNESQLQLCFSVGRKITLCGLTTLVLHDLVGNLSPSQTALRGVLGASPCLQDVSLRRIHCRGSLASRHSVRKVLPSLKRLDLCLDGHAGLASFVAGLVMPLETLYFTFTSPVDATLLSMSLGHLATINTFVARGSVPTVGVIRELYHSMHNLTALDLSYSASEFVEGLVDLELVRWDGWGGCFAEIVDGSVVEQREVEAGMDAWPAQRDGNRARRS